MQVQSLWKQMQSFIYSVMTNPKYNAIAPFVFHGAEIGSEPIGDGVDGDNFITDLAAFRSKMKGFGVPVAISEDWDRPGTMSGSSGSGPGSVGKQVKANSDMVHGQAVPYYHDKNRAASWNYIAGQVKWYSDNVGLPAPISEVIDPQFWLNVVLISYFTSLNGLGVRIATMVEARVMSAQSSTPITGTASTIIAPFSNNTRLASSSMHGRKSRHSIW